MSSTTNNIIVEWVKKDWLIIAVCLLCLLACVWTLYSAQSYQEQINKAWLEQWESSGCMVKPYQPNITFQWGGIYNEDKNRNQDTPGTS